MSKTEKDTLKINGSMLLGQSTVSGTMLNLTFCKNGVIKLKKKVPKSKL